ALLVGVDDLLRQRHAAADDVRPVLRDGDLESVALGHAFPSARLLATMASIAFRACQPTAASARKERCPTLVLVKGKVRRLCDFCAPGAGPAPAPGAANQSPSGLAQLALRPSTVTSW